jgi:predicted nucleotidyltransferase
MRKYGLLQTLFSRTRRDLLATLFLAPDRWWYMSDLTVHLGRRNPSSLQRELKSLAAAGILERRAEGKRVYFRANRQCAVFPEISSLMAKTAGLAHVVLDALATVADQISLAFIHGSVARNEQQAASDVDVVVVGAAGLAQIAPALRSAEERLGRAVNVTVYSEAEFQAKLKSRHHFLASVLAGEKLFLIGNPYELEKLAGGPSRPAARHKQAGVG